MYNYTYTIIINYLSCVYIQKQMMSRKDDTNKKRITMKPARPNPLFQSWLEELYEDAKKTNNILEDKLKEALTSMSKYPLPLQTGADCIILKGFDKKLCKILDMRLKQKKEDNANSSSDKSVDKQHANTQASSEKILSSDDNVDGKTPYQSHNTLTEVYSSPLSKKRNCAKYKPVYRSGSYAILVALLEYLKEFPDSPFLKKEELIVRAQKYSEEPFFKPKPGLLYTAWSNMSRLIKKGLVEKRRSKYVEFSLTAEGKSLATELLNEMSNQTTANCMIVNGFSSLKQVEIVHKTKSFKGLSTVTEEKVTNSIAELESPTKNYFNEVATEPSDRLIQESQINARKPFGGSLELTDANIINHNFIKINSKSSTMTSPLRVNSHTDTETTETCNSLDIGNHTSIYMPAGSFEVILLIDKNETSGVTKKCDPLITLFDQCHNLQREYRNLKIGDYTWIARHKVNKEWELVLPYVVERKRMDDLAASIKDDRYYEQKFRLKKCGLKNVIYLVENYGNNKHIGLPVQSLMQAIANTRVQDKFKVHVTDSLNHTVRFLVVMSRRLMVEYMEKDLRGVDDEPTGTELMTFSYFNSSSCKRKTLTVKQTFISLLMQLKGVSLEKALAITEVYSTPKCLIQSYERCDEKDGELLLANLKYGMNRNVGPTVSKLIYKLFSNKDLL